jgi:hypothetical protein
VSVGPEQEAPRAAAGQDFSDAITVAFGDERADLYGVARLGLAGGTASGLVILFRGGQPVAVVAEGGAKAPAEPAWEDVSAAGLDTEVVEPLRRWRLHFAGDDASFDLSLEAVGAIAELPADHPAARAGGMTGYEQLVRVEGPASVRGDRLHVHALGQRGHSWGAPDWERIGMARTLSAWLGDDLALTAVAVRPRGEQTHAGELVAATILEQAGEDGAAVPVALPVEDPRLSTTYDADGRQRQAGLELWVAKDDPYARQVAGEALCGTSLGLGRVRLDCAFFRWRTQGRSGVGRYDIVRHAGAGQLSEPSRSQR